MKYLFKWFYYFARKTPLAWLQLSHQRIRLIVAIVGVAFSNILIFTQLGLRALLFDGITLVPQHLNGDLYLVSAFADNMSRSSFPLVYLYQADAISGIERASPLYLDEGEWVNPTTLAPSIEAEPSSERKAFRVKILAFNPTQPVFNLPEISQQLDLLTIPGGLLYDRLSQSLLGDIPKMFAQRGKVQTIMNNRRVLVVGLFSLGSTVSDQGHTVMSDWNYGQQEGLEKLDLVSVGVLKLEPGANPIIVRDRLKKSLTKDLKILTPEELIKGEQDYIAQWPEGKILNFGAAIGFIVGVVIVYQVIYTDVSEHLPEYATLKAMGYDERSLSLVVLQESLILALMGFIPGFLASYGVYHLLEVTTKIPLEMNSLIVLQVFILTVFMCIISGAIAINKLRTADPADIFH
jgi:putative ABC transport system permease protein